MMRPIAWIAVPLACLAFSACSTASKSRVIRREDGKIEAVARGEDPSEAVMAAVDKAEDYCHDQDKEPIFPDEANLDPKESMGNRAERILKKLPGVGSVISSSEGDQVFVPFRCG